MRAQFIARQKWVLGATWVMLAAALGVTRPAYARKTNQPIYEDPFDIAAGGASLTRASKEGMLFSNPALLPEGGKLLRWIGSTFTLLSNKESVDTAKEIVNNARSGGSSKKSSAEQSAETQKFVDKVFHDPVRVGWGAALSLLMNNFGLSVFSRFEPDIRAKEFGANGLPEVDFQAESYHGVAMGTGWRTPFRPLFIGVTAKYLMAAEPQLSAEITDQQQIKSFANPKFVQDFTTLNKAIGYDAGALLFLQGSSVDASVAAKIDDLGNTKFTAPKGGAPTVDPKAFKQVESAGLGLTFHTGVDAVHFAADFRDLADVYGEPLFKRVYVGTKITLRTYLGLAAGYYNGYPSMGAEVDLLLMRVAFTSYTRELGDHPGVDPRHIYMLSTGIGF